MTTFTGKRIAILGGSSGIGFAIAEAAAAQGAQIVIASSRQDRVDMALAALPGGASGFAADLSREADIRRLLGQIGRVDHLVFTAGEALTLGRLTDLDIATAQQAFVLRYWGALTAVKYASGQINAGGSIVLSSGLAKDRPHPGWSIGASICGAMEALTRALAVELAPLRVNLVSPGVVRTPLWNPMDHNDREAMYRDIGSKLLTGAVGEPQDVAQAYLYLMQQPYSTGQCITVDGGGSLV